MPTCCPVRPLSASVRRIAARERGRTAADLMEPIPTITLNASIHEAAAALVKRAGLWLPSPCKGNSQVW